LDERQIKLTSEFKAYQQRFQFTHDDIQARENRISQIEFDLEDTSNQLQVTKSQLQDLQTSNASLKNDYDVLLEQKRNTDREITRLESTVSELQMDFTANHQQLKKEVSFEN
jgi:chromosome segregation ATPase